MTFRFSIPVLFFITLLFSCKPTPEKLIVGKWKIQSVIIEDPVKGKVLKNLDEPEQNYTEFFSDGSYFKNSVEKTQNGKYHFLQDGKMLELVYKETGVKASPEIKESAEVGELSKSRMKLKNRVDKIEVVFVRVDEAKKQGE